MQYAANRRLPRFLASLLAIGFVYGSSVVYAGPCDPPASVIACENSLPGTPSSVWDLNYGNRIGDYRIQGFATEISVNHGDTVQFKINVIEPLAPFYVDVYRIGYYQGNGARLVAAGIQPLPGGVALQPDCYHDAATDLLDCGNWHVSAEWSVPSTAVSGIYIARIVRTDDGSANHIPFIVRADESHSDIVVQTSDTTWQAYNGAGHYSLYPTIQSKAVKVSYNRPFTTRDTSATYGFNRSYFFSAEYPAVRWLERNGYDVTYVTGVDIDRNGALLLNHKAYVSVGHDEYWSRAQRDSVETARDAGVHLAFLSGNTMFWKVRWEDSPVDGGNRRTLVCYKESTANDKIDPNPQVWTGLWRDPRFVVSENLPSEEAGRPENELIGTMTGVGGSECGGYPNDAIQIPYQYSRFRFWRNTRVANLEPGSVEYLATGVLGYEWDVDRINDVRPSRMIKLSETTLSSRPVTREFTGDTADCDYATHNLTLYRHQSGALVFSAGSVQWSWGLDSEHDEVIPFFTPAADRAVQQATMNLLADMGAQPATPQADLVPTAQSADANAPTSAISGPPAILAGGTVRIGNAVVILGTAEDTDGQVALVEVSVDGGATYRPATGTTNWTFTWVPNSFGASTVTVRATDDSGNSEIASPSVIVSVGKSGFDDWEAGFSSSLDSTAVEIGVKFRTDLAGSIAGIRFLKEPGNGGAHVGSLWTSSGDKLAEAMFSDETATGWQEVRFSTPVPIQANATYVASYYAPLGRWSYSNSYFGSEVVRWPLRLLATSDPSGPNGVYAYGQGFPSMSGGGRNYWVDVVFVPDEDPTLISLWDDTADPSIVDRADGQSIELGVKFTSDTEGTVSGIRFYKGLRNIGSHNGSLWRADGTFLGQTDFGAEEQVGWQMSLFRTPIRIVPNSTYVASYWAPFGHWAVDRLYFAEPRLNSPLRSPAESTGEPNGVFCVGGCFPAAGASFPQGAANFWVDLVFRPDAPPPLGQLWGDSTVPGTTAYPDSQAVELGLKFKSDIPGFVQGIRFYKSPGNVGTHHGHLWSATGNLLAAVEFSAESEVGWQQADFTTPVAIDAGTTYVVSYFAPNGHYAVDRPYLTSEIVQPPIHALENTTGSPNGVYKSGGGFPTDTPAPPYHAPNYWVDVVFSAPDCPPQVGCTIISCSGGTSCRRGTAVFTDTGMTSCKQPNESFFTCPDGQSIHSANGSCYKCPCCNQTPGCLCPPTCGTFSTFECR